MACVSMASFSILVNGDLTRQFKMRRGLHQGCPLSLCLFNMVAEALSILLHKAVSLNLFNEIKVGNGEVLVSHLQYTDDTIIFIEPAVDQLLNVKKGSTLLSDHVWS